MRRYQVISADGHCEAPFFGNFVEKKYADVAPKLFKKDDGTEWWRMGEFEAKNEGNLFSGARYDDFVKPLAASYHFPDGTNRPGTGDAKTRLREQDLDGIDAEVLYPPVAGPRFLKLWLQKDKDAHIAMHRGYNSFLADYCSIAPDRLIGNGTVPETGVDDAIKEMERCKKLGLRSICLNAWPSAGGDLTAEDDRFWAAAIDLDMKISPHVTFGGVDLFAAAQPGQAAPPQGVAVKTAVMGMFAPCGDPISKMIERHVFDRFPKLKFYFAETNAGWLPFWMNQVDEFYLRWYSFHDLKLQKMPSQYIRDHCRFSIIQDRMAIKYRHDIGLDLLMWGSDFPHSVGSFPVSREVLSELFEDVPANERKQILVDNVCNFFGLDPEKDLTPTPK